MTDRRPQIAIDDLEVGIAQLNLDGRWLSANRRLCDVMQFTHEELMAIPFENVFRVRDPKTGDPELARLLSGEIVTHVTERSAVRKTGRPLRVRIRFSLQRDASSGKPHCILAAFEDLTDLRWAEATLREAETARRELARRLTTAQENERTRIARELHDDIGQSLAVLRIEMSRAGQPVSTMPGRFHPGLSELSVKLRDIAQKVSQLSHQLHSSELEYLGLEAAVQTHCLEVSEKFKIAVNCTCREVPRGLDSLLALSVLRVIQEALHNGGKYSRAKAINVELRGSPDELSLLIADNGVGFDLGEARLAAGLGLISMRERIHLAGGKFAIASKPGEGTRITATVPLTGADKPDDSL